MFNWFKSKEEQSHQPLSALSLDAAIDAVARYGSILELQGTAILDVSKLPLLKTQMKIALKMVWRTASDDHMRNAVEQGYVYLAHFQEGVGDKPIDCKLPPDADPAKTVSILDRWLTWSKKTQPEMSQLIAELYEFTGKKALAMSDSRNKSDRGKTQLIFGNRCIQNEDYAGAAKWYRSAADEGNVQAQSQLGHMYLTGQGVTCNYAEAIKWARLAAEQGDAAAQALLGDLYVKGQGVPVDYMKAAHWCRKAADQGNAMAQLILGSLYHNGQGVPQNFVQAHMLLSLAASGFPPARTESISKAAYLRDFVASKMAPAQIAEAQALFHDWKPG